MNKATCPICGAKMPGGKADWPEFPFCSPRCRKIDLGRWLDEKYRVPAAEPPQPDPADGGEADDS